MLNGLTQAERAAIFAALRHFQVLLDGNGGVYPHSPRDIGLGGILTDAGGCRGLSSEGIETLIARLDLAPAALRAAYVACGSCGHYHRAGFRGDCRDDSERFTADDLKALHGPDALDYVEGEGEANA